ncbi:17085_t:CDS:1, partial [Dentiscutata erythropus]
SNSFQCENIPSKKRVRKSRSPGATEALYFFKTVMLFIGQKQMPDNQNTASINSYKPSLRTTEVQNNDSLIINPYQNITLFSTSHLNETFFVETPLNIYRYKAAKTFPNMFPKGPAQDNSLLIINRYQNITLSSTSHFNDSYSLNIYPCRAVEVSQNTFLFVHEGPVQNNNPLIINPYTSLFISYSNNFFSLETPNPYNNTITSPNIYAYGTNEQSFLLSSSSFVHEGSIQNNNPLTTDLSQSTNNSNDSFSFETTNFFLNVHPYETTEVFQNMFID